MGKTPGDSWILHQCSYEQRHEKIFFLHMQNKGTVKTKAQISYMVTVQLISVFPFAK